MTKPKIKSLYEEHVGDSEEDLLALCALLGCRFRKFEAWPDFYYVLRPENHIEPDRTYGFGSSWKLAALDYLRSNKEIGLETPAASE